MRSKLYSGVCSVKVYFVFGPSLLPEGDLLRDVHTSCEAISNKLRRQGDENGGSLIRISSIIEFLGSNCFCRESTNRRSGSHLPISRISIFSKSRLKIIDYEGWNLFRDNCFDFGHGLAQNGTQKESIHTITEAACSFILNGPGLRKRPTRPHRGIAKAMNSPMAYVM
jgi:hypothetical protein